MNIVPKEVRKLISQINYGKNDEINVRAKMLYTIVAMQSKCVRICSTTQIGKQEWKQIISYDNFKVAQLKDLKKKSDKEFIRQAINYFCYMTKLLNDLDMEKKGMLPNGMFSKQLIKIINSETLKHKQHDIKQNRMF